MRAEDTGNVSHLPTYLVNVSFSFSAKFRQSHYLTSAQPNESYISVSCRILTSWCLTQ